MKIRIPVSKIGSCFIAALLAISSIATAQTPVPIGADFRVDGGFLYSNERQPTVGVADDGRFIVVWTSRRSFGDDTSEESIQGRRYDSSGRAIGAQFQINVETASTQEHPAIAMRPDGEFLAVWTSAASEGSDQHGRSIQGLRFASDGSPIGAQFQINDYTTDHQEYPAVAADEEGNWIVAWSDRTPPGEIDSGVRGRKFDSAGNPVAQEFQVNDYTTGGQGEVRIAADAAGGFVAVWTSRGSPGDDQDGTSVQARLFDSFTNPRTRSFQINQQTAGAQLGPVVASEADGDFIVTWSGSSLSGDDQNQGNIYGRRFDSHGQGLIDEFRINTYAPGRQWRPQITLDKDGDWVVVWIQDDPVGDATSNFGRRFSSLGEPLGEVFQVEKSPPKPDDFLPSHYPAVGSAANGRFVVVWSRAIWEQGYAYYKIYGRRFAPDDLIFADGFESGDLGAWSRP